MASLSAFVGAFALMVAVPAHADPMARWRPHIAEASARYGIPSEWIERVIRAESGGRTMLGGRPITSRAGAMGLMQLMPGTWADLRVRLGLGPDPHQPRDNIIAGTAYLRMMYDRFGYPGMFAAYNAGPGRYSAYLAGRSRLPGETIAYLHKVTGAAVLPVHAQAAAAAPIAPAHGVNQPRRGRVGQPSDPIFFIRRQEP